MVKFSEEELEEINAYVSKVVRGNFEYRELSLMKSSYTLDEVEYLKTKLVIFSRDGRTLQYERVLRCLRELGIAYDPHSGEFSEIDGVVEGGFDWDCFV